MFAKKWFRITLVVIAGALLIMQFIPVEKTNPPVKVQVKWVNPQVENLARRACYDCHSNETVWPWYSKVAPVSFLVARDVVKGRKHLNFSEDEIDEFDEMVDEIKEGRMPFPPYKIMHPEARLSDAEQKILIDGIKATFGGGAKGGETKEEKEDEK